MIRAVLFDMDGVLADSEAYYFEETLSWLRQNGWDGKEEALYGIIGAPMHEIYDILYRVLDGKMPREELACLYAGWFEKRPPDFRELMFPGVPEVLSEMADAGIRNALCSSGEREYVFSALEQMGITGLFDIILCRDEYPAKQDMYKAAVRQFCIPEEECVIYEDSSRGIEAGKQAGISVIARRDPRFGQDQGGADLIADDIFALKQFVIGGILCRKSSEYAAEGH